MNNQQFRRLLDDQSHKQDSELQNATQRTSNNSKQDTKRSGFVGLAPRNVKRSGQTTLGQSNQDRPAKKFKSSVPKGSDIAEGYVDRAKARALEAQDSEKDEKKASEIRALEKQLKDGDIDHETFETLREEITAGDISNTHLVKGLDRTLLDRVRRGEDVLGLSSESKQANEDQVDDELDRLEDVDVETIDRGKTEKKGQTAAGSRKQTRDEIMAELKAQRRAAAESKQASEPALDVRWRRIDERTKSRIELDRKGREVLITVDEDGVVKKRVRKIAQPEQVAVGLDLDKPVLGDDIIVPEQPSVLKAPPAKDDEDDDDDIFENAGTDYDPLGPDEDSDASVEEGRTEKVKPVPPAEVSKSDDRHVQEKRNYFTDRATTDTSTPDRLAGVKAIIEKAAKLAQKREEPEDLDEVEAARRAKHAAMLANRDRDLDDMDMGFGASRHEDGEDADEGGDRIRLSEWKGASAGHDDDNEDKPGRKHDKKKRKPKARKGDANNIADIMNVLERRKDKK